MTASYFDTVRGKLNRRTLRQCQDEAFTALANYYGSGGRRAACIMSVGAGKTALGVLAALAFTQRCALVVTPGSVQLKMLGQGYDFPPITVVVPMRPYGSFSEFYQFVGRGIRVVRHPALDGRVCPGEQLLDVIYHAELGLDAHIETIYQENDMDPPTGDEREDEHGPAGEDETGLPGTTGNGTAERPEAFVLFERGTVDSRVVHDPDRVEQRRRERELEALAQKYASYAESSRSAITFEEYVAVIRSNSERDDA